MTKISNNAKGAILIGFLSVVYIFEGRELEYGSISMPGEGYIPFIIGATLLACCILLVIKELAVSKKASENEAETNGNFCIKKSLALMAALLLYPLLLPYIGFLLLTPVLLFVSFRIFDYSTLAKSAAVAILATAITYGVFEKWLVVLLFPKGIWG